jgi:hypothetical protein
MAEETELRVVLLAVEVVGLQVTPQTLPLAVVAVALVSEPVVAVVVPQADKIIPDIEAVPVVVAGNWLTKPLLSPVQTLSPLLLVAWMACQGPLPSVIT